MDKQQILMAGMLGYIALASKKEGAEAISLFLQAMQDQASQQEIMKNFMNLQDELKLACIQKGAEIIQSTQTNTKKLTTNQQIGSMTNTYNAAPTPTAVPMHKMGDRFASLNGKCPEGYEVERYLAGGCVKCKKGKQLMETLKQACGGSVKKRITKKKEQGGEINALKCGKKMKKAELGTALVKCGKKMKKEQGVQLDKCGKKMKKCLNGGVLEILKPFL